MNRCLSSILALFLCVGLLLCACNRPTQEPVEEPAPEPSVEQDAEEEQEPEQKPEPEPPMSEIARKLEENTPFEIIVDGVSLCPDDFDAIERGFFAKEYNYKISDSSLSIYFKPSASDPQKKPTKELFSEIPVVSFSARSNPDYLPEEYEKAPFFWHVTVTFAPLTVQELFAIAQELSAREDVHLVEPGYYSLPPAPC